MDKSTCGRCFCGEVRFVLEFPSEILSHCHCESCRLSHGSAFVTWTSVPVRQLNVTAGTENIQRYRSESGAEWGFCRICGASMFYEIASAPGRIYVTAASLGGPLDRSVDSHVSYEERVSWFDPRDDLPKHKGKTTELIT